ncbi:MAG: polysaccharide biosynthesis/export family protein [Planctomycetota bacterium]
MPHLRSLFPASLIQASMLAATALLGSTGCSSPHGPPLHKIAPLINETLRSGDDVIAPGDLINVRVISEEVPGPGGVTADQSFQLNQDVRVQSDGRASFVGLDDMQVSGLLPSDLDEVLTTSYAKVIPEEPLLSVTIAEQAPRFVTVIGELNQPGIQVPLPPDRQLSIIEAFGAAGGPSTRTAWLSNTLLVRWDPAERRQRSWKIDARRKYWGETETVFLQPHDVVFVPNTNVDYIAIGIDNFIRRMIPAPQIFVP